MSGNNNSGVTGLDGYSPVYNPNNRFQMWNMSEIYRGDAGENKYVPNPEDLVVDMTTGEMYNVIDVDPITLIPVLEPFTLKQDMADNKLLSTTADNFRIYYDKSVSPYTLNADAFLHIYNQNASYARIYRGTELDPTKVISRRYDNSGNFLGHDIPLTMLNFNSHDNYGVKGIPYANCDVELVNGEVCTIVIFTSNGKVVNKANCIVEETTFVAQAYAEQKYITEVFLKSAFIDTMGSGDIHFPVNLPIPSFNPVGVVQYNDGSQVEYPVDGDKFNLYGLDQFLSTIIGHKVPLVLSYKLSPNESAIANVSTDNNFITRNYNLIVSEPNRSYNVKFYVFPYWVSEVSGYRYKVYLMNLDRNILYDVTNQVGITQDSSVFDPLAYGVTQRLRFTMDLIKLGIGYRNFIHIQTVDIILRGAATNGSLETLWEVGNTVPTSTPYYGEGLRARLNQSDNRKVYLGNDIQDVSEFISRTFRRIDPIYNPLTEVEAPDPTHIEVRYGGEVLFDTISNYDREFQFSTEIPNYSNVDVIFYKETPDSYLKLGIVSMCVR